MKVAYLASKVTFPGSPTRRTDAFEHDEMMDTLRSGFTPLQIDVTDVCWDDENVDWSEFDAVLIGTTWDYWDQADKFLTTLKAIEQQTELFNPTRIVEWNMHKSYLREMKAETIPTVWLDDVSQDFSFVFDELKSDDVVFKRQVGAGAFQQVRISRDDEVPEFSQPMMAQGFIPDIQTEGEYSFVFVDGELSHALLKKPDEGDYRIQAMYGGREIAVTPDASDLSSAKSVIDALDEKLLYARVDMVRSNGRLLLMELEVIEPFLYPVQGPELGAKIGAALRNRLQ